MLQRPVETAAKSGRFPETEGVLIMNICRNCCREAVGENAMVIVKQSGYLDHSFFKRTRIGVHAVLRNRHSFVFFQDPVISNSIERNRKVGGLLKEKI